jgi:hypothetical protein
MAEGRRYDIIFIVLIAVVLAAYASIHSEYRLRSAMPNEFFDASHASAGKRAGEEKVARAYWNCAVTQVQWKYGYAHRLPDEPPEEFSITAEEAGSAARDATLRTRYWQKLRDVWSVSAVWHKEYEWNSDTLRTSFQSAGRWLEQVVRRIAG